MSDMSEASEPSEIRRLRAVSRVFAENRMPSLMSIDDSHADCIYLVMNQTYGIPATMPNYTSVLSDFNTYDFDKCDFDGRICINSNWKIDVYHTPVSEFMDFKEPSISITTILNTYFKNERKNHQITLITMMDMDDADSSINIDIFNQYAVCEVDVVCYPEIELSLKLALNIIIHAHVKLGCEVYHHYK